jgi:hypothetical protein
MILNRAKLKLLLMKMETAGPQRGVSFLIATTRVER